MRSSQPETSQSFTERRSKTSLERDIFNRKIIHDFVHSFPITRNRGSASPGKVDKGKSTPGVYSIRGATSHSSMATVYRSLRREAFEADIICLKYTKSLSMLLTTSKDCFLWLISWTPLLRFRKHWRMFRARWAKKRMLSAHRRYMRDKT